jgi:hypothetical protein
MSVLIDNGRLDLGPRGGPASVAHGRDRSTHLWLLGDPENVLARLEYWQLNPDVTFLHQVSSSVSRTRTLMKYGLKV